MGKAGSWQRSPEHCRKLASRAVVEDVVGCEDDDGALMGWRVAGMGHPGAMVPRSCSPCQDVASPVSYEADPRSAAYAHPPHPCPGCLGHWQERTRPTSLVASTCPRLPQLRCHHLHACHELQLLSCNRHSSHQQIQNTRSMAETAQGDAPEGAGAASGTETTNKFQAAISAWRSMSTWLFLTVLVNVMYS